MSSYIVILLILVATGTSLTSAEIYFSKGAPHVKLSNNALLSGSVELSREGRPYNSFLGVPYATVAERFKEAEPAKAWEGIYSAVKPGHVCVQLSADPHTGKPITVGNEDCLNLNVHVPMNNTQRKGGFATMVWIHGGGYNAGSGFFYGPKFFMDEDIILVTLNYRLGVFGFLSTGDSVISGNTGLKDQALALRWVQENIKNFGGDPGKVTIFGESAGAGSVHQHILSPTTNGLFHRAISQSGSALAPWALHSNPKARAIKLATHLKCPTTGSELSSAEIQTCLMGLSKEELNLAQMTFNPRWPVTPIALEFGPVIEPKTVASAFLTDSPWSVIPDKSAPLKEIPWMVGNTEDEGAPLYAGHIFQNPELVEELNNKWSSVILRSIEVDRFVLPEEHEVVAEKIRKFYFGDKPISSVGETRESLTNLYSDILFVHSVRKAALETASRGKKNPVYLFQYDHHGPGNCFDLFGIPVAEEEKKKVGHGDDFLLEFNLENMMPAAADIVKPDSVHEEFSKNFIKLWVSFAIHGKPKYTWGTSKEEWRPISKSEVDGKAPLKWYKINSNPSSMEESDKEKKRALFWEQLFNDHFLQALLPGSSTGTKTEL